MEDEIKSIWGPTRPEEEEEPKLEKIGTKTPWLLKEQPNFENIHPKDMKHRCKYCGNEKEGVDCFCWCPDCGDHLDEESGYCDACDEYHYQDHYDEIEDNIF